MQMEVARRLRKTVAPCKEGTHKWVKEYFDGANTGDYLCSICGAELSGLAYEELQKKQTEGK